MIIFKILILLSVKIMLALILLIALANSMANPGILITIPLPISPPAIFIPLPLSIGDVVISGLELSNIQIRQLDYSWILKTTLAEINISKTIISFDWAYKKDHGKGFFIESELKLDFSWKFTSNKDSRLLITVTDTKIHPGKSKVELGGGVSQTVAVEVTNLILNHASITFRGIIASKLSAILTNIGSIIGKDVLIYHDSQSNKNIKVNTTLVSSPLISNQTLYLLVNGAPYIEGTHSGYLNCSQILVKSSSPQIQAQIHKLFFSKIADLYLSIKGQISFQFISTDITSTVIIDSLGLSPVFPHMAFFPEARAVVFTGKIPKIDFDFSGNHLVFKAKGQCVVSTQTLRDTKRILYMSPINASASIQLKPIFGRIMSSLRIENLQILTFDAEKEDIENGLIVPSALTKYFGEFMQWVNQAVNLEMNRRTLKLSYNNILAVLRGKVINNYSYNLEVDLIQAQ